MNFNEYQQLAERTAQKDMPYEEQLKNATFGMVGEVGEFVDLIKKHLYHGHDLNVDNLVSELGDILWYWQRFVSILHLSADDMAKYNIEKLKRRYPDGFSEERSWNRDPYAGHEEVD